MFISRQWRNPKIILGLFGIELCVTVAALALFGIADPNLYRTRLWQDGADNGFNSSPSTIVYAAANYKPVDVPLVWSQFTTNYNVVIAVLSLFLALVKLPMFILRVWYPLLSVVVHAALVALYAYSLHAQTAPDTIDPEHQNHGAPWYITKKCSVAYDKSNVGYCQQAKASFAVTVLLLVIFVANFVLATWSAVPTKEQKLGRETSVDATPIRKGSPDAEQGLQPQQQQWEMEKIPRTPGTTGGMKSPMTPRSLAFNRLGGSEKKDLPLRRQPDG